MDRPILAEEADELKGDAEMQMIYASNISEEFSTSSSTTDSALSSIAYAQRRDSVSTSSRRDSHGIEPVVRSARRQTISTKVAASVAI